MKLFFVLIPFIFYTVSGNAQLEKSTWLFGGAGSFYSSKREYNSIVNPITNGYSKELYLNFSPQIGYFVMDKVALGFRPFFSWSKGESFPSSPTVGGGTSISKRYGIGPFVRYYFINKEKQFNILTDINYQFGVWDVGKNGKLSNFSFLLGPAIYFNTSIGIEFLLGYNRQMEELRDISKNSSTGFIFNIGFQIHLIK